MLLPWLIVSLKLSLLTTWEEEVETVSGTVLREEEGAELWLEEPVHIGKAEGMQIYSVS